MIRTIFYHELLNLYRERLAVTLLVTVCLLALLALFNGHKQVNEQRHTIQQISLEQQQAIQKAQLQLQQRSVQSAPLKWWDDVADARGYAFYLMVDYAVKSPSSLAPLAVGQSDIYPYFFRMQVDTKQTVLQEKNIDHPLLRYLGRFDLTFLIVFIFPLLLITLNFNAVTQEQERNQIKLIIIQGLSPARLLFVQLFIRTSIILLPVLLITVLGLIYGVFTITNEITLQIGMQLLGVLLMMLAYSLFWSVLSAWCIARGKSAAHNATVMIAFWLVFTVAIPMLSNTLVNMLAPLPSRVTYIDTLRTATDRVERETEKTLANFFQDHPELARKESASSHDYALTKIAKIDAIEKAMHTIEKDFSLQLSKQQEIAARLKWLSPASLLYQALIDASGNGLAQHRLFIQQVEQHHQQLRRYFQEKINIANQRGDFNECDTCLLPVTFSEFDQQLRFNFAAHTENSSQFILVWLLFINFMAVPFLLVAGLRLNKSGEAVKV